MSAVRIRPRTPSWASSSVGRTPASQAGGHGFESRPVHHRARRACANGELTELADGARLLSEYGAQVPSGVRIPDSPPFCACHAIWRGGRADDCGGSENRLSLRGHEGSNPSLSSRARGAAVAQGTHNPWVAGSNPAGPTNARHHANGPLAQSGAHLLCKQGVASSSLARSTNMRHAGQPMPSQLGRRDKGRRLLPSRHMARPPLAGHERQRRKGEPRDRIAYECPRAPPSASFGEVAEWLNAAVLKTAWRRKMPRGFEPLPLRQHCPRSSVGQSTGFLNRVSAVRVRPRAPSHW